MASRCASAWVGTAESKELSPESVCGTATASAGTAGAGAEASSAVLLPKDAVPEEDDITERNWRKGNTRSQLARAFARALTADNLYFAVDGLRARSPDTNPLEWEDSPVHDRGCPRTEPDPRARMARASLRYR